MKKILNLVAIFFIFAFTLVLSLLSEPSMAHAQQPINPADYITGTKNETIVIIANNINNGTLSSRKKDNSNGASLTTPLISNLKPIDNLFNKENIKFNKDNNNYISNNEQTIYQIRAP